MLLPAVFIVLLQYSYSHVIGRPPLTGQARAQPPNCPLQLVPVPLDPVPQVITNALTQLESVLESKLNSTSRPCASFTVVYRGKVIMGKGVGENKNGHSDPTSGSVYRIASVTKVFVDIMVYQLWEKGLIASLDDEFEKYAPNFSIKNPFGSGSITIRQMMSQLSGLPLSSPCTFENEIYCNVTSEEVYARLSSSEQLIFPPATIPSYSNLAFALLGNALTENLTGMTFQSYVEENILKPLEMTNTGFTLTNSMEKELAIGYNFDGSEALRYDLHWSSPAGQLYSNPQDLAKLGSFFMSGYNSTSASPPILKKETLSEMLLPEFINPDGESAFGTPWEMFVINDHLVLTKSGDITGYSALFSFIPNLQLGVNILWSGMADAATFNLQQDVYSLLLPAFSEALSPVQPKVGYPSNPQNYEGMYEIVTSIGNQVAEISSFNNTLVLEIKFQGRTLLEAFMEYVSADTCVLFLAPTVMSCMLLELVATTGEQVKFKLDEEGKAESFTIPGMMWGSVFNRK